MTATATATAEAPATPATPAATPTLPPTPPSPPPEKTATPAPPPHDAPQPSGLFTDPRDSPADMTRTLGAPPPSVFPAQEREHTVLYDTETGEATDLGPGYYGEFSPDGARLAWVSDPSGDDSEVHVIEIATGEQQSFGEARWPVVFIDEHTIRSYSPGGNRAFEVDTITGEREELGEGAAVPFPDRRDTVDAPYELDRGAQAWWTVVDRTTGEPVLVFEAASAVVVDDGTVALVTVREDASESSNIFTVDVETGEATFIATVPLTITYVVPLVAGDRYIVWTDNFCTYGQVPQGNTRYLDRQTGELVELDVTLWPEGFTPDGRLRVGWGFGALMLVDLERTEYDVVLPEGISVDVRWSPDYRYASSGAALGHGGVCPP